MASVWLIRAGAKGEDEAVALKNSRAIIGFRDIGDLSAYVDVDAMATALRNARNDRAAAIQARQLWAFSQQAQVGDMVVMPLKTTSGRVALGWLTGIYEFIQVNGESRHTRKVNWARPDTPRSAFRKDLLLSFGAFMTVCRIRRNNTEQRMSEIIAGKSDPGILQET